MSCGQPFTEEEVLAMDLVQSVGGAKGAVPAEETEIKVDESGFRKQWEHVFGGQAVMEGGHDARPLLRVWPYAGPRVASPFSISAHLCGRAAALRKAPGHQGCGRAVRIDEPGYQGTGRTPAERGPGGCGRRAHGRGRAKAAPASESADAQAAADGKAEEQGLSFGWKELAVTLAAAVVLAGGLFIVVPLVVVKRFEEVFAKSFLFNLVAGVIRIVVFLLYIMAISLIPDLRRVFQYHGAEHKVIHAYEAHGRPDAERAAEHSPLHPRCGTGFLLVVMVVAILVFAGVGKPSLLWLVVSRIVGIPVIIGISYEVGIKWLGRHPNGVVARVLLWPGLQLQRLTTREPTADQLEVAAAALDEVMRRDEVRRPELKEVAAQA